MPHLPLIFSPYSFNGKLSNLRRQQDTPTTKMFPRMRIWDYASHAKSFHHREIFPRKPGVTRGLSFPNKPIQGHIIYVTGWAGEN